VTEDEAPLKMDEAKLRRLQPYFRLDGGTITASNASPLTDGAGAGVLASGAAARRLGLPVLAKILGFVDAAVEPRAYPEAPAIGNFEQELCMCQDKYEKISALYI
jgi:acetyl-CoA C-acetyltransferase